MSSGSSPVMPWLWVLQRQPVTHRVSNGLRPGPEWLRFAPSFECRNEGQPLWREPDAWLAEAVDCKFTFDLAEPWQHSAALGLGWRFELRSVWSVLLKWRRTCCGDPKVPNWIDFHLFINRFWNLPNIITRSTSMPLSKTSERERESHPSHENSLVPELLRSAIVHSASWQCRENESVTTYMATFATQNSPFFPSSKTIIPSFWLKFPFRRCFLTLLPRDLQIHFWGMAFGRRSCWSDGHRSSRVICGDRVPVHGLCSDSFAVVGLVGQFWVTPCPWWAQRQIWYDGAADSMTVWHSIAISQCFFLVFTIEKSNLSAEPGNL